MRSSFSTTRRDVARCIAFFVIAAAALAGGRRQAGRADEPAAFQTEVLQGRVVYLADALERKFAIKSSPDARERILALETKPGELVPLVEDLRGHSFRIDKRLRDMDVELTVRRYTGSPAVQVIRVCELAKDGKYEVDYWCSICSIAMFELKECECCQGPIELRKRKVDK
jgi:ferric-dicitrate binding protein FerR (iron transport regulator)